MVEARKKEVEAEENDPENFPEAPRTSDSRSPIPEAPAPVTGAPVAEEAPDIVEPPAPVPSAPAESSEADLPPVA
jgi:hypothetical protein